MPSGTRQRCTAGAPPSGPAGGGGPAAAAPPPPRAAAPRRARSAAGRVRGEGSEAVWHNTSCHWQHEAVGVTCGSFLAAPPTHPTQPCPACLDALVALAEGAVAAVVDAVVGNVEWREQHDAVAVDALLDGKGCRGEGCAVCGRLRSRDRERKGQVGGCSCSRQLWDPAEL